MPRLILLNEFDNFVKYKRGHTFVNYCRTNYKYMPNIEHCCETVGIEIV